MATLRQLVSSVDVQLQQLSPDSKIPSIQLYMWGMWLVNKYKSYQAKTVETGSYLTVFPAVAVTATATAAVDIVQAEKYSVLPQSILDLEGDRGIDYISYIRNQNTAATVTITRAGYDATVIHSLHGMVTGDRVVIAGAVETEYNGIKVITKSNDNEYSYKVYTSPASPATGTITALVVPNIDVGIAIRFTRTTPNKAVILQYSPYEEPSAANPYWYRHGNYIGYLGLDEETISYVEMGLLTSFDPFDPHDIDDNLDILTEYADEIFKDMVELGRFGLLIPEENFNDGSGEMSGSGVPQGRVTSVNKSVNNMFDNQQE